MPYALSCCGKRIGLLPDIGETETEERDIRMAQCVVNGSRSINERDRKAAFRQTTGARNSDLCSTAIDFSKIANNHDAHHCTRDVVPLDGSVACAQALIVLVDKTG